MTKATIVGAASTQSRGKRPGKPVTLTHCSGVYEYSTDGRKILSWPMGQYGGLLGYVHHQNVLVSDLINLLDEYALWGRTSLGSYPSELEQRLADKLATLYAPYLRSPDIGVRFFSNGTDACQAAVALSRYATGCESFVSVGYHGGSSPVFAFKPQNGGVLQANEDYRFDWEFGKSIDWIDDVVDKLSSIIIEVPSVEDEIYAAKWLAGAMDEVTQWDGYSIFDDIVTGFRYAPVGALEYYSRVLGNATNIKADFICLGKALSTYGKVSALLGPLDVMNSLADKVFASFTYNDHPLGFADALWTLGEYEKHGERLYGYDFEENYGVNWTGVELKDGLNTLFYKYSFPAKCIGHPVRSAIVPVYSVYAEDDAEADKKERGEKLNTLLSRVVDEHDILLHRPNFVTLCHTPDHVSQTLAAVESVLKTL